MPLRSATARAPVPMEGHCWLVDMQTLKGRSGSVSVGSLSPGVHKVLFEPSEHLWRVWDLILNAISPFLLSCWGFSFAFGCGVSFLVGSNILLLIVVQPWVATLEFSQKKMSAYPSTPPSCEFGSQSMWLQRVEHDWALVYCIGLFHYM